MSQLDRGVIQHVLLLPTQRWRLQSPGPDPSAGASLRPTLRGVHTGNGVPRCIVLLLVACCGCAAPVSSPTALPTGNGTSANPQKTFKIEGHPGVPAATVWEYLDHRKRTVDVRREKRVRLHNHLTFVPHEGDPTRGRLVLDRGTPEQQARIRTWLTELSARGVGFGRDNGSDVIDPTDLESVLLWEDVVRERRYRPLFEGGEALAELLTDLRSKVKETKARRKKLKDEAEATVESWEDADWRKSYWHSTQRERASDSLFRRQFDRTDRRQLRALKARRKLLEDLVGEMEGQGTDEAQGARLPMIDRKTREYIEIHEAAARNEQLGLGRQVWAVIGHKLGVLKDKLFGHGGGDASPKPFLDSSPVGNPRQSTFWQPRAPEAVTPLRIYRGPWLGKKAPQVPEADELLSLHRFRDFAGDGLHPSVNVRDDEEKKWKVKFYKEYSVAVEPIMSRLFYAMGYNTDPIFHAPILRLEARAVAAAFRYKNRIPWRRFGYTPYKIESVVRRLEDADGTIVYEKAAGKRMKEALKKPEELDRIGWVEVAYTELEYKEGDWDSIGPWNDTDLSHHDRREVRAVGMVMAWALGNDYKFNNVRLDILEKKKKKKKKPIRIAHVYSDVGGALGATDPDGIAWTVDVDPEGAIFHDNRNNYSTAAWDLMDLDDARWAIRRIGRLTESQLTAAFAAGSHSWPVTRLYIEKFIARRDDLVCQFGLEGALGLLRPEGPEFELTVRGDGVLTLQDDQGEAVTIHLPANGFSVVDGQIVSSLGEPPKAAIQDHLTRCPASNTDQIGEERSR